MQKEADELWLPTVREYEKNKASQAAAAN